MMPKSKELPGRNLSNSINSEADPKRFPHTAAQVIWLVFPRLAVAQFGPLCFAWQRCSSARSHSGDTEHSPLAVYTLWFNHWLIAVICVSCCRCSLLVAFFIISSSFCFIRNMTRKELDGIRVACKWCKPGQWSCFSPSSVDLLACAVFKMLFFEIIVSTVSILLWNTGKFGFMVDVCHSSQRVFFITKLNSVAIIQCILSGRASCVASPCMLSILNRHFCV